MSFCFTVCFRVVLGQGMGDGRCLVDRRGGGRGWVL